MKGKITTILLILFWGNPGLNLIAQKESSQIITVRIPFSSKKSISHLPGKFFRENLKNDSLDLEIAAEQLAAMKDQYPGLKVRPAAIALDASDMANNLEEALTFNKYPTYPQYDSMMHYFADTYPALCKIDTIGYSVEGRLLLAVKISDNVEEDEDEPAFLYTSTMHGDELVGYVLCLRLIDFILSNYDSNIEIQRIVNDLEIWINPLSNPDKTYYGTNFSVANSVRPDSRNLNRGFPDPASGDANDTAGIYLENQYMMLFMMEKGFNLSANMHSGAEVVNYPWDIKYALHPDDEWYKFISREYADLAHDVNPSYMEGDGFVDGITNGADWYVIYGGRQDYVNYYLHGREVTLELSNVKQVPSELLEDYWNYNQWSLINYISQARYGIHGNITSRNTGEPLKSKIWVLDHDDETSWVESDSVSGKFYRYLKEGSYNLTVSSEAYISDTIYNVQVTDYHKTELNIQLDSVGTIPDTTGIHVEKKIIDLNIKAYPNPATDKLTLLSELHFKQDMMVEVYSPLGSQALSKTWNAGSEKLELDVSGLNSGFYMVRVSGLGSMYQLGFVVR